MEDTKELMLVEEVAEKLRVDPQTVYRWLSAGKLPGVKILGLWRVRRDELDAFIASGAQG